MTEQTTVLVVEDDLHLLSGIRDILSLENYNVLTAQNGKEGLDVLHQNGDNPPEVIVSDIMMPHMDGFAFLEAVRGEDRWVTVPFIFLTAKGEKTDRHRGNLLGADVYLTKPFEAEDLLVAVSSSVKRYSNVKRVTQDEISDVKDKILTILNHEFRTPLTLVVAYADMLKEFDGKNMSGDEVMSFLHGVNSGAERLKRLVENFIILVELDSGDANATFAWRKRDIDDFEAILQDAYMQVGGEDSKREFIFDMQQDFPPITIDVQFMTVVLRELFDNAVKFSDEGGRIVVNAHVKDGYVNVNVRDYGRGIPESEIEKIWEPFYQYDRKQFEDQGSGSGLALIRGLVGIHNGTANVESQLGDGSRFTIRFPVDQN